MELNERIKKAQKEFSVSRLDLIKALEVTGPTVDGLLKNPDYNPKFNLIVKLSRVFPKVNPCWLILGEGEMLKEKNTINRVEESKVEYNNEEVDIDLLKRENEFLKRKLEISNVLIEEIRPALRKILKEI